MRIAWLRTLALASTLVAGCMSLDSITPRSLDPASRTFAAPMARVKPAFVSTLASMGMSISAVDVRGGREIIRARSASKEVEIELESVSPATTRARVAARSGGLLYDDDTAAAIIRQTALSFRPNVHPEMGMAEFDAEFANLVARKSQLDGSLVKTVHAHYLVTRELLNADFEKQDWARWDKIYPKQ